MKKRDLWLVAVLFVALGFAIGAVVMLLHFRGKGGGALAVHDAAVDTEPTPLPPLDPEPDDDDVHDAAALPVAPPPPPSADAPRPVARADAAGAPVVHAVRDAGAIVVHAQNLLIHPVGHEGMCVDYSSRKHLLHLIPCHGRKNQRWTAGEDVGGAIRLANGQGGCVVVGGTADDGGQALTLGDCTSGASHFKGFESHRLQETQTGKCLTARRFDKGTQLSLQGCDPGNPGQGWSLGD